MKILSVVSQNTSPAVSAALKILRAGGLVIYPTETCYGLGVDATNAQAVQKLLKFKTRRQGKAISVAVADQTMAQKYVALNPTAKNLYRTFLPGPLTVVSRLKKTSSIAPGLASERGTLGIRIPDHLLVLRLVAKLGRPVTATSANVSYKPPPYSLSQWLKNTPQKSRGLVNLWLDAGFLPRRSPSTVIDTTADELTVIRQGAIRLKKPEKEFLTHSQQQTQNLAARVIHRYRDTINSRGLVIALQGELGAGKTVFAQGVARALGIKHRIKSPTFALVHEYEISPQFFTEPSPSIAPCPRKRSQSANNSSSSRTSISPFEPHPTQNRGIFYHLDTWRMEKASELLDLDFLQMLRPKSVVIVEWAEKASEFINDLGTRRGVCLFWATIDVLGKTTRRWRFSSQIR